MTSLIKVFVMGTIGLLSVQGFAATELARINNRVITLEEFNKKYQENLKYFPYAPPNKLAVLEDLIKRELGIQEATRLQLNRDPEIVDRMNTVLYQSLLEKQLGKKFESIVVSSKQAVEYYSKFPEIRTSHIFIGVPDNATKEQEAEARKRIQEIQDRHLRDPKASFAEIAQQFSEGVAAPVGGDLDYQTRDKLDPAFYDTAVKLKVGQMSRIVRTKFGFHIIKLTGIRPWKEVDQPKIKRLVLEQERQRVFDEYMKELKTKAAIKINSAALKD